MTRKVNHIFGRRSGTTLVELLVVILIIAILSAMLLPAFTKNVTQAHYAAEAIPLVGNIRTMVANSCIKNPERGGKHSPAR